MRTIDFLVQELPKLGGWPDGAIGAGFLCGEGTLYFWDESNDCPTKWRIDTEAEIEDSASEISREQYEAALAAKNDGWIDWDGGECPVDTKTLVDIKLKDGCTYKSCHPGDYSWRHGWHNVDIIAYRLHKPQEVAEADDEADLNECIGQDASTAWNGEGFPPVGLDVEYKFPKANYRNDFSRGKVLAYGNQQVFMEHWSSKNEFIQPLDNIEFRTIRSEADKKREAICDAIYGALTKAEREHNRSDEAEAVYDAIAEGKIPGVKLEG